MAVCTGSASLTPPERAELLTLLAEDADETVRDRSESALVSQPLDAFAAALAGESPGVHLLRYCGKNLSANRRSPRPSSSVPVARLNF